MYKTDPETLDLVINQMTKDLEALRSRKGRTDKGKKRKSYTNDLPKDYRSYLNRANKKGLIFALSIEEFNTIRTHSCVYCGSASKIGIDRKDSSIGYTLDNSQPACGTCNLMKYTWDEEVFLRHVAKIYKHKFT